MTGLRDLFGGSRSCIVRLSAETFDAVASDLDPEFTSQRGIEALFCAIPWLRRQPPYLSARSLTGQWASTWRRSAAANSGRTG